MRKRTKPRIEEHHFTDEEIESLKNYRDQQEDSRLKKRFLAFLMVASGISLEQTCEILKVSKQNLQLWYQQYLEGGLERLNQFNYKPKQPKLSEEQLEALKEWVKANLPSTKQTQEWIREQYEVFYSEDGVRKLLKSIGLKSMKPRLVPGNPPDEATQQRHIDEYEAINEWATWGVVHLFVDAMHLIHQVQAAFCWGDPKDPPIFKTNSSRQRLNILGAYEAGSTPNFIHLTGEENCNSERAIEFFKLVLQHYPDHHSIVLTVDNAPYFKSEEVQQWLAEHPQLILRFLPPYSPNLNLIERFWRFTKKKLTHNTYYAQYKTFRAFTFRLLNNIEPHHEELTRLINGKFEIVHTKNTLQAA